MTEGGDLPVIVNHRTVPVDMMTVHIVLPTVRAVTFACIKCGLVALVPVASSCYVFEYLAFVVAHDMEGIMDDAVIQFVYMSMVSAQNIELAYSTLGSHVEDGSFEMLPWHLHDVNIEVVMSANC